MKVKEFIEWLKTQNQEDEVCVLCKRENSFYESVNWEDFDPKKHAKESIRDGVYLGSIHSNDREQ